MRNAEVSWPAPFEKDVEGVPSRARSQKYHPEKHCMRGPGPATRRKELSDVAPAHIVAEATEQG
ncbi:hypothetical protein MesoLjLc_02650 [Mesorhizobium sp. L-8-10]|nr:hypothetical protein MesoLjLc_02650 [Mesorhizobium sp. L-8-10]